MSAWSVLLLALTPSINVVQAQDSLSAMVTFNSGIIEPSKTCLKEEWSRVDNAVSMALDEAMRRRSRDSHDKTRHNRRLLRSVSANASVAVGRNHRRLPCTNCGGRPLCLAFSGRGCAILSSRRRHLSAASNTTVIDRSLNDASMCMEEVDEVDKAMAILTPSLSTPCRDLVNAPRTVQCVEFTTQCDIRGFALLQQAQSHIGGLAFAFPNSLRFPSTGSTHFCRSVSGNDIAIRVDAAFVLGAVTLQLRGPNNYFYSNTELGMPYSVFGKETSAQGQVVRLLSRPLAVGSYTLSAVSLDNPTAGITAYFTVKDC